MTRSCKRILLSGAASLTLLPWTAVLAQDIQLDDRPPQAQQQKQQQPMNKLQRAMNLTAEQKKQWQQINRETNQKIWAARKDDSLNEAQMQAQIREIHRQHNQQLLALLSPEQQETLKQFWEEQKQRQQAKAANDNLATDQTAQATDNSKVKEDDDLFAGMVSDDPAPAQPAQNKKAPK